MKTTGARCLLEWVSRANYDGRYEFWFDLLQRIDRNSWFWGRYEDLYWEVAVHKRAQTHYLFTAAIQFQLSREPSAPLTRYFPDFQPGSERAVGMPLVSAFLDFCAHHWQSIENVVRRHEVQINKLGRNAVMLPLLCEAQARAGDEAIYVEAGSSIGLGLLWPWLTAGFSTGSRIDGCFSKGEAVCHCRTAGNPTLPLSGISPKPARLVGIEIDPLSADNEDDVAWLRALVASNDDFGRRELDRGIELLRQHRPEILAGCVLDRLRDVIASMSDKQPLIVYHCMTLHHLIQGGKLEAWRRLLYQVAQSRPVVEAYVAWEEGEPSSALWPVEVRIREWHREGLDSELIGWTDPSADGTLLRFKDQSL